MQPITLHWVESAADIPEELWERAFPPPLEGLWWYRALEQGRLEDQFRFTYGVLARGEEPIGIVPTFEMKVPIDLVAPPLVARVVRAAGRLIPQLRYLRTVFVGSPCSEEGTIGLVPGEPFGPILEVTHDTLEEYARRSGVQMIVWKDFPDEAKTDLEHLSKARRLFRIVSFPGTRVPLRGGSFDDYVAALKSPKRHRLRRNLRRGREACPLVGSFVTRPDGALLQQIFTLFWQTYERGKTKFERLTPEFFAAIAAAPPAHFALLRDAATGRLAAFMLLFLIGKRAVNKFIGIDYSLGGEGRLYFQLWELAVHWAYAAGVSELQSGQTGYQVKLDLGHELVPLTNYCQHRNRIVHRLFAAVTRRVDWASLDEDLAGAGSSNSAQSDDSGKVVTTRAN
jgi:Acetyltransferase (GNAT) domain